MFLPVLLCSFVSTFVLSGDHFGLSFGSHVKIMRITKEKSGAAVRIRI